MMHEMILGITLAAAIVTLWGSIVYSSMPVDED